jgi:hypothetical protein
MRSAEADGAQDSIWVHALAVTFRRLRVRFPVRGLLGARHRTKRELAASYWLSMATMAASYGLPVAALAHHDDQGHA